MDISKKLRDKYKEMERMLSDMEEDNNSSSLLFPISIKDYNIRLKRFSIEKYYNVDVELFLKCLLTYSELLINYLIIEYPQPTLESTQIIKEFMNITIDVLEESIKLFNLFILNGSNKIFDIVSAEYHWSKNELLVIYNTILQRFSRLNRISKNVIQKLNPCIVYNLVDMLGPCGDYDFQAHLIETVYRLFNHNYLKECGEKAKFFPESHQLDKMFINIDLNYFDESVRSFLIKFNENAHNVYSICCETICMGDLVCEKPSTMNELYLDYNLGSKSLSWYCLKNSLLSHYMNEKSEENNSWCLIRVFLNEIEEINRNENNFTIKLKPTGIFRSTFEDLGTLLNNAPVKILKLSLKDNKNAQILSGNLRKSPSTKISVNSLAAQRKRPVYQPLNVKLSRAKSILSAKTTPFTSSLFNSSNNSKDEIIEISSDTSSEYDFKITKKCEFKIKKVSTLLRINEKSSSSSSSSETERMKMSELVILSGNCSKNNSLKHFSKLDTLSDDIMRIDMLSQFGKNANENEEIIIINEQIANQIVENNNNVFESPKTNKNSVDDRISDKILSQKTQSMSIGDEISDSETPPMVKSNSTMIYSKKFLEKFGIKQFHINLTRPQIDESVQENLSQAIKLSLASNNSKVIVEDNKKNTENLAKRKKFTHNLSKSSSRSRSLSPLCSSACVVKEKLPVLNEEQGIMSPVLNKFEKMNTNSDEIVDKLTKNNEKMEIIVEKCTKPDATTVDNKKVKKTFAKKFSHNLSESFSRSRSLSPLRSSACVVKEKLPVLNEEQGIKSPVLNKFTKLQNNDGIVDKATNNEEKMEIIVEKCTKPDTTTVHDKKVKKNVAKKFSHNLSESFLRSRSPSPLSNNGFRQEIMSPILNKFTTLQNNDQIVDKATNNDEKMEIIVEKFTKQDEITVIDKKVKKTVPKRRLYDVEDISHLEDVVEPSTNVERTNKKKKQMKKTRHSVTQSVLSINSKQITKLTPSNGRKKRKSKCSFVLNELDNDESDINCLVNVKRQSFPFNGGNNNNNQSIEDILKITCRELYPNYNRFRTIEANSKIKIHSNILLNPPLNDQKSTSDNDLITIEKKRLEEIITMCNK